MLIRLFLFLFLLFPSISYGSDIGFNLNGKSGIFFQSGALTPGDFSSPYTNSYTKVMWLFNGGASANEIGITGQPSSTSLTATQSGSIPGAIATTITGATDDAFSRTIIGASTQYWTTASGWISSVGDWTVEIYTKASDTTGVNSRYLDTAQSTSEGYFLSLEENKIRLQIQAAGGGGIANVNPATTYTANTWIHMIAMKKSTTYYAAWSSDVIDTPDEYIQIPSGQKATVTNATAWTPSTNAKIGGRALDTTNNKVSGVLGLVKIFTYARFLPQ